MHKEEPTLLEKVLLLVAAITAVYGFATIMFSLEPKNAHQPPAVPTLADHRHAPTSDYESALSKIEREFPLRYTATITQYGDGIKEPRTRFYIPKERK